MEKMSLKKGIICILILLCGLPLHPADGQQACRALNPVQVESRSRHYRQAYLEMADMLDGKIPLSIKRAVFLAEWAYLDGELDYDAYCLGIDTAVAFLQKFIASNGLEQYKTGKNLALTEYFIRPYSGNGYKPFTYDFDDTGGKADFTKQFVTKVMRTHSGQCRSLPMYYKVLAETLGAEAYIAYAPAHVFIRYRNEDKMYPEEWVNVELTTHQITPEFFYKEHFEISDKAIENKIYLTPLTDRETVAAQLADLAFGYRNKFKYYDAFTRLCAEKSLEYYPQHPKACIILGKSLDAALVKHLKENGYKEDAYTRQLEAQSAALYEKLKALGWEAMSEELYDKLEKGNEEGMKMQEATTQ
ncbi:hypothetical protein [uncultured Alistipes sp.]|jgi:hypothetical protein|uniref:hypothetical protein n=1 Tax=uncultured Alistipes sp. TaxID=538949 RepID=UPI0025D5AF35|nr:hypothetical protein [uncultured Alistipes sp.]